MATKTQQVSSFRPNPELAEMINHIAASVRADAVICGTETGSLFRELQTISGDVRIVAATPNTATRNELVSSGSEVVRLSIRVAHKYRHARHAVSSALRTERIKPGDLIVCAVGHNLCRGGGDLILVTDVEVGAADIALSELIKLTDGIRPSVLEAALQVACKIGRVSRQGKKIGAVFVLGDSNVVLESATQLILNPFHGQADADRFLTESRTHEMLIELAKRDGAFIVRGDGFIRTAGAFLAASECGTDVPSGLGARHMAAAAATSATSATAVVVSATDGYVRAFSGGTLELQMDPDAFVAPLPKNAQS